MIKKLAHLTFGVTMLASCAIAQQRPFSINGNIQGKNGGYIYLSYADENDRSKMDSSLIENGKFSFTGKLNGPAQVMVMMNKNARFYDGCFSWKSF